MKRVRGPASPVYITNDSTDSLGTVTARLSIGDAALFDSFGRFRVSDPLTLFDSKQLYDSQPLFWDDVQVSGGGTATAHSTAEARTRISVSNLTAGRRVRQTFMRFNYQPGKSQSLSLTFANLLALTGNTKIVGYGDDNNGLFLKSVGGTVFVVKRSSASGAPVDTSIAQSDWNVDPFNGQGPSGITLDFTKTQILVMDFEWLGVGSVRFGFVINGRIYFCHVMNHANSLATVYMSTPNLPIRYEISNAGTGASDYLDHICSTVISEGGSSKLGVLRHDYVAVGSMVGGNTYATIGIKLQSAKLSGIVEIENVSLTCTSANDRAHWTLRLNPTVADVYTYTNATNSVVAVAKGVLANTVSGGTLFDGGYFSTDVSTQFAVPNAIRIGSTLAGVADSLVLCVRPITTTDVEAAVTWRELS